MFKMVFLQFLYDLSDRDIEEQCTWNMLFKSFLGLSAEELPPNHSTLCRFRLRLGAEGSQKLFTRWWSRPGPRVWCRTGCTSSTPPT